MSGDQRQLGAVVILGVISAVLGVVVTSFFFLVDVAVIIVLGQYLLQKR